MLSLFDSPPPLSGGVLRYPDWNYVRDGLRRNVAKVVQYYHQNPTAVQSSHFLVRLLHSLTVPKSLPVGRYYDNVDAIALNLSMALKMTSSIYKGEIFDGVFYGDGSREILIAHHDWFDPELAHKNWKFLQPVRVLRCPHTNLGFNIPDGKRASSETGVSVISINIPLLAIQYRAFRKEEEEMAELTGIDSQRSIYQFIRMYPLTNMLFSQTDVVVFNRIFSRLEGAPMGESSRKHSFYLTDFAPKLNAVQDKILDGLQRTNRDFYTTMRTVPVVFKDTVADVAVWPDMAPTRQVVWALVIGRIPLLRFLFDTAKGGVKTRNAQEYNQLVRDIKSYRSESLFRSMLSGDLLLEVQQDLEYLMRS